MAWRFVALVAAVLALVLALPARPAHADDEADDELLDGLELPDGFRISLYTNDVPNACRTVRCSCRTTRPA